MERAFYVIIRLQISPKPRSSFLILPVTQIVCKETWQVCGPVCMGFQAERTESQTVG